MTDPGPHESRHDVRGAAWVLVACVAFGAAMEAVKSETGFGYAFRSDVGNWSALWLVLPLVMGYQFRRPLPGALGGVAATMSALVGFYVVNAVIFPQPGGLADTVTTFTHIMARWALFGLVSGPVFGAAGTRLRSVSGLALVSGVVMVLEPLVLDLWSGRRLPLPEPLAISWWFEWRSAATVEVLLGALLVVLATRRRVARRGAR